jgi:hypothetical protein
MLKDGTPETLFEWNTHFARTLVDEGFCLKQTDALEIASNHATECGFDDSVAEERDPVLDAYDYIRTFNEIASTHEEHCAEGG